MLNQKVVSSIGFTLIELIVVIAIAGIMTTIAYPAYQDSIRKARRGEAKSELSRLVLKQHKFRVTHTAFADDATLVTTDSGYYEFLVTQFLSSRFSITATPKSASGQDQDLCATLTIDQDALIISSQPTLCPAP